MNRSARHRTDALGTRLLPRGSALASRLFLLLALSVAQSFAAVYYVDASAGSDTNTGTSTSTPWKYIPDDSRATGNAAAHTPEPGDVFAFKGGVNHGGNNMTLRGSGTSANRITYDGSFPGWGTGRAVLAGTSFNLNGRSYVTIRGFEMKDQYGAAIYQDMDANIYTGVIIDNNIIHNYNQVWKSAIYMNSTQECVVSNNEIYDIDYNAAKIRGWGIHFHGRGAGGAFQNYTPNNVIRGNRIYRTGDSHIAIFGQTNCTLVGNILGPDIWSDHSQGITYYYNNGPATIVGNYYKGDRGALTFEGMETVTPVLVANNIFDSQNNVGYVIASWGPGATGELRVINNVIIGSSNHHALGFGSDTYSAIIVKNNILDGLEAYDHSNNLFIYDGAPAESGGVYETDLTKIFVDHMNGDYRLKPGSPAIDTGTDVSSYGVGSDFAGVSRPQGAGTDIGAYEYTSSINRAPVANAQSVIATKDTATAIALSGSDADGNPLTYTIATNPAHGALSGNGASRTYTPATGYTGADSFTFTVNDGTVSSNAATVSITVSAPTNQAPVVSAATATPSPVTAKTTNLSATATDDGGELALGYTWSASGPAAVTFSPNGSNVAKASTATFTRAGSYTLTVTAKDAGNLTGTRSVTVTVNATPTTLSISPTTASVQPGMMVDFNAVVVDQFATTLATQPTPTWTVSGGGTINANGLFTAGAGTPSPSGGITATTYVVTATAGSVSNVALVTVSTAAASPTGGVSSCGMGSAAGLILALGLMSARRGRR